MNEELIPDQIQDPAAYNIDSLEDEIRVDHLCAARLKSFCHHLLETGQADAEEASSLARGASYFLREFVIPHCRENLFHLPPRRIREFAGNWYIVNNVEPNLVELTEMLTGVALFYRDCSRLGLVEETLCARIEDECRAIDYYRRRIDDFLALTGDGFMAWNRDCPLTARSR